LYENSADAGGSAPKSVLRVADVQPRADQPRKDFDDEALAALADSIALHGVIEPLIVRKGDAGYYEIIAGERRWRAAKLAGLTELPVVIVDADDRTAAELSLIENLQREDLNPIEEAAAYRSLVREFGLTQEELAARVSKSRAAVANTMLLLDLPEEVIALVSSKKLSEGHARALRGVKDPDKLIIAAGVVVDKGLSVRDTESLVRRLNAEKDTSGSGDGDNSASVVPVVDYRAALEKKMQARLGRRVSIRSGGKVKRLVLEYTDNDDLEALAVLLCGKDIFDD